MQPELLDADPLMTTYELADALGISWPTARKYRDAYEAEPRSSAPQA